MRKIPKDDPLLAVGTAVRERRKVRGVSQEELAEQAELHRTYIGSVERGERNVTILSLIRIAEALGVRPHDLLHQAGL